MLVLLRSWLPSWLIYAKGQRGCAPAVHLLGVLLAVTNLQFWLRVREAPMEALWFFFHYDVTIVLLPFLLLLLL